MTQARDPLVGYRAPVRRELRHLRAGLLERGRTAGLALDTWADPRSATGLRPRVQGPHHERKCSPRALGVPGGSASREGRLLPPGLHILRKPYFSS